jgi:hypothetical protein
MKTVKQVLATIVMIISILVLVLSIVEAVSALPFIPKPLAGLEPLSKLAQEIESFQAEVQNLRMVSEQKRTEIIQGAVSIITIPTSQIRSRLDGVQTMVSDYSLQPANVQEGLSAMTRLSWCSSASWREQDPGGLP